jgi:dihydroorotase/N-acyl-D-amino-acid deacylase
MAPSLSTGLLTCPTFTPTAEVAFRPEAGALGGIHIACAKRRRGCLDSVNETIRIGEEGHLPTQVTHHKIVGKGNWGRSVETLRAMEAARARGVDVTIDQYPYTASSTGISVLFPRWALEGTDAEVAARIADPAQRAKIKAAIIENLEFDRGGATRRTSRRQLPVDPSMAGKTLIDPWRQGRAVSCDAADVSSSRRGAIFFHAIGKADLRRSRITAGDGEFGRRGARLRPGVAAPTGLWTPVRPHAHEGVTSKTPAQDDVLRMGLADRGILRPGMKADLVVFDPERVGDRATFDQPHQYAVGIDRVFVNGTQVYDGSTMSTARPGRVLRGPATTR